MHEQARKARNGSKRGREDLIGDAFCNVDIQHMIMWLTSATLHSKGALMLPITLAASASSIENSVSSTYVS